MLCGCKIGTGNITYRWLLSIVIYMLLNTNKTNKIDLTALLLWQLE